MRAVLPCGRYVAAEKGHVGVLRALMSYGCDASLPAPGGLPAHRETRQPHWLPPPAPRPPPASTRPVLQLTQLARNPRRRCHDVLSRTHRQKAHAFFTRPAFWAKHGTSAQQKREHPCFVLTKRFLPCRGFFSIVLGGLLVNGYEKALAGLALLFLFLLTEADPCEWFLGRPKLAPWSHCGPQCECWVGRG